MDLFEIGKNKGEVKTVEDKSKESENNFENVD